MFEFMPLLESITLLGTLGDGVELTSELSHSKGQLNSLRAVLRASPKGSWESQMSPGGS